MRKLFLYGFVFPDAMYHAIWGVNEDLPSPDAVRAMQAPLREDEDLAALLAPDPFQSRIVSEEAAE